MAPLRREVLSPVPGWRKPHSLAGLFFATLLFATSLDALMLSYRLRVAELTRSDVVTVVHEAPDALADLERVRALVERARLDALRERAFRSVCVRPRPSASPCAVGDPLCGL